MKISRYSKNGIEYMIYENNRLKTTWLPAVGGKLISLYDKKLCTEMMNRNTVHNTPAVFPRYGAVYQDFTAPGIDECFPTIDASDVTIKQSAAKNKYLNIPDHGELWALPWNPYHSTRGLIFRIHGVVLNYEIEKHIRLSDREVTVEYYLTNHESFPIKYIWAAHFNTELASNDALLLEKTTIHTMKSYSTGNVVKWLDIDWENDGSSYQRLYSTSIQQGYCGVQKNGSETALLIHFPKKKVSHLAVQFSAIENSLKNKISLSIMPSIGFPGSLADAIHNNTYHTITAQSRINWKFTLRLEKDLNYLQKLQVISD